MADAIGKCTLELANEYCPQSLTKMLKNSILFRKFSKKQISQLIPSEVPISQFIPQNEMRPPPKNKYKQTNKQKLLFYF